MAIISSLSEELLKTILGFLPNPSLVEVGGAGDFDYSNIDSQASRTIGGINLRCKASKRNKNFFILENPTNEQVLQIYRKGQEFFDTLDLKSPSIMLQRAYWELNKECENLEKGYASLEFKARYSSLDIKYKGDEPEEVSKIVEVLSDRVLERVLSVEF